MKRIAVVGGGIAGLTVALRCSARGDEVTLFEASDKIGGQLASERTGGFVIEHGAEGFVARSEAVPELARAVGAADHLIDQLVQQSFCFEHGQLIPLAPGEAGRMLGFQVGNDELGRGIRSFKAGMAELAESVAASLQTRCAVALRAPIAQITPLPQSVRLELPHGEARPFDAVVVATTARSAAALLARAFGEPARALEEAKLSSSVTVSLAYRTEQVQHSLAGTGVIVPSPETLAGLRAVTFVSSKLPHRAPADHVLMRCFFRPSPQDLAQLSDAEWRARAEEALGHALPISGRAERAWVSRWQDALPIFDDAHRARIAQLEGVLAPARIRLAGSAFHGSGIDAAVRSAERVAAELASG